MYYFNGTTQFGLDKFKGAKKNFEKAQEVFADYPEYAELSQELDKQIINAKVKMEEAGETEDDQQEVKASETSPTSLVLPIALVSVATVCGLAYAAIKYKSSSA